MAKPVVCIVTASGQNLFFEELMDAVEAALAARGLPTERAVDHFPAAREGLAYLFVPHEYMPLVLPEAHPTQAQLDRSVALCTEQPGTHWFDEAAGVAARSARAVDLNREGVAELRRRGIGADFLQLGHVPGWDHWGGDESSPRPIDVTFMGGHTPRRARALASCAAMLSERRASLHVFESALPHTASSASFLSGARKWDHLASSRVILNVHRSELPYCEWQRVVGAMANGCVVVTEHSLGMEPFVPGEHFVTTYLDDLPHVLRALLDDEPRLRSIRQAAYEVLRSTLPMSETVEPLVRSLERAASREPGEEASRESLPAPRETLTPMSEYERLSQPRTEMDRSLMALKQLFLGQQDLRRRLDQLQAKGAEDRTELFGPYSSAEPRVSVLLTVYNYEALVGRAIRSVALSSQDQSHDLVVVDDGSSDGSADAVRAALAQHPWLPARVISRGRNHGLPAARNLAAEHARGEYVFVLDADNFVYPHALGRLADALDAEPNAAFAYGILEVFNSTGPADLKSWLAWDPHRLRFGNFVDAMAMLRRATLLAVGGYSEEPRLFGWEDFALWCALADRGHSGIHVPEILGAYRSSLQSMISLTDIDASAAWSALVERYPVLSATAGDS